MILPIFVISLYNIKHQKLRSRGGYILWRAPTELPPGEQLPAWPLNAISRSAVACDLQNVNKNKANYLLYMACMVSIRRIVTYKIFINKQLIYANVTIRLALFIYINIPVHRLSSSCAKLVSDVGIAVLAILSHEYAYNSVDPLSSEDVAVVVDFHWFTDCHLEAIFNMNTSRLQPQSPITVDERCSSDHRR